MFILYPIFIMTIVGIVKENGTLLRHNAVDSLWLAHAL